MGIGPAPSSRQALERAGLKVQDMDLAEINEAFATQYLAVEKDLGLDREKTNVNGGAIALGHPLGASGARLALTLAYELRKREKRYGLASLCIGGGPGGRANNAGGLRNKTPEPADSAGCRSAMPHPALPRAEAALFPA